MTYLLLHMGRAQFLAQLVEDRAPSACQLLLAALPTSVSLLQEEWSGAFLKSVQPIVPGRRCTDAVEPYQAPGRLYLEPATGSLAICYGQGRLQDGYQMRPVIPVAELLSGFAEFFALCQRVQFEGITEIGVEVAPALVSPPEEKPAHGRRLRISLSGAAASAVLLEADCPEACAALVDILPLAGIATNTHSSGPLVRFWNKTGGREGETPLPLNADEARLGRSVLVPGSIYYLPKVGFRGFRIPFREPTAMRSAIRGGGLDLIRIAEFDGDWSGFRDAASRLRLDGAQPMEVAAAP